MYKNNRIVATGICKIYLSSRWSQMTWTKVFCYSMFEESIVLHQSGRVASTVYSLAESHFLHSNENYFIVVSD